MTDDSPEDANAIAAKRLGQVLVDKWRLERVLGVGGMATVYAATHRNNLRAVAIKLLHSELASNADIKKRFLREGYIANKVSHPGAVSVLDDGVDDDGNVFLVMDLLVGESLHARQARTKKVPEDEVMRIADGILDVLAVAHEQGIVHRDLKPDNVFLTKDGGIKVLDFGIARLLEPSSGERATRTGLMIGTPAYMPPEQARGRSKEVDERSDLWSVGAIMYALLTGRHVHEGETPNEVLLRAMTVPATALEKVLPNVNHAVAVVVDRALAFEPNDRWPDARAMRVAVREALACVAPAMVSDLATAATVSSMKPFVPPPPLLVTPVTRASTPIVADVASARPRAGRLLVFSMVLGAAGFAGISYMRGKWPLRIEVVPPGTTSATTATAPKPSASAGAKAQGPDASADGAASPAATSSETHFLEPPLETLPDGAIVPSDGGEESDDEDDEEDTDEADAAPIAAGAHAPANAVHGIAHPVRHKVPQQHHPQQHRPKKHR